MYRVQIKSESAKIGAESNSSALNYFRRTIRGIKVQHATAQEILYLNNINIWGS